MPAAPAPTRQGQRTPAPCCKDGQPVEGECLAPDVPHSGDRSAPPGNLPPAPEHESPGRPCRPEGQCRLPAPAQAHRQHVGSGPQPPARWVNN